MAKPQDGNSPWPSIVFRGLPSKEIEPVVDLEWVINKLCIKPLRSGGLLVTAAHHSLPSLIHVIYMAFLSNFIGLSSRLTPIPSHPGFIAKPILASGLLSLAVLVPRKSIFKIIIPHYFSPLSILLSFSLKKFIVFKITYFLACLLHISLNRE